MAGYFSHPNIVLVCILGALLCGCPSKNAVYPSTLGEDMASAPTTAEDDASVPETSPFAVESEHSQDVVEPQPSQADFTPEASPVLQIISREEAGLQQVPYSSWEWELHPTVIEAYEYHLGMDYPEFFPDEYYQAGLEAPINHHSDALIVTDRWGAFIIADISIGSTREDLTTTLGEPSQQRETETAWRYSYKTEVYYLIFEGELASGGITCAAIAPSYPMPGQYHDALKKIVGVLEQGRDYSTFQQLAEYDFFEGVQTLNGGVLSAESPYGIHVLESAGGYSIIVYNNFAGELYQFAGQHAWLEFSYWDSDPYLSDISYTLDEYHKTHDLEHYTAASYDGRYYIHHEIVYAQAQYIWVYDSTLQRNPYRVPAERIDFGGYGWMDDSYTIYCFSGFDHSGVRLIEISDDLPVHSFAEGDQLSDVMEIWTRGNHNEQG